MITSKKHFFAFLLGSLFASGLQAMSQSTHTGIKRIKLEEPDAHFKDFGKILEDESADLDNDLDKKLDQEYNIFENKVANDFNWQDPITALQGRIDTCLEWIRGKYKDEPISIKIVDPKDPKAPKIMRENEDDCAGLTLFPSETNPAVSIYINKTLNIDAPPCMQYATILHELAHAVDPVLTKPTCKRRNYPKIAADLLVVQKQIQDKDPRFSNLTLYKWKKDDPWCEWHAEWQAIEWMKELLPDQARNLKKLYEEKLSQGIEIASFPKYPSYAQMIKWLS